MIRLRFPVFFHSNQISPPSLVQWNQKFTFSRGQATSNVARQELRIAILDFSTYFLASPMATLDVAYTIYCPCPCSGLFLFLLDTFLEQSHLALKPSLWLQSLPIQWNSYAADLTSDSVITSLYMRWNSKGSKASTWPLILLLKLTTRTGLPGIPIRITDLAHTSTRPILTLTWEPSLA